MKKLFAIACFGALCAVCAWSASAADGVVTADLLNIRMRPDAKSTVAVKLDKGCKVEVLGESGEFLEIAAPMISPVYVSAVYLDAGTATAPLKMYVAGNPAAATYGTLPRGTVVKLIDIDRYGWARIEPPAGTRLYAAKRFVKVTGEIPKAAEAQPVPPVKVEEKKEAKAVEAPAPKAEEKKEQKPAAKADEKKEQKSAEKPAVMDPATEKALKDLGIDLSKSAALSVTGTLLKLETTTVPALGYVLMRNGTHEYYLCADKVAFDKLGGAPVTLQGHSFRVPGWRVPVLYVESAVAAK